MRVAVPQLERQVSAVLSNLCVSVHEDSVSFATRWWQQHVRNCCLLLAWGQSLGRHKAHAAGWSAQL